MISHVLYRHRNLVPARTLSLSSKQWATIGLTGRTKLEVAQAFADHAVGLFCYVTATVRNGEGAQNAVQQAFLRYFVTRSQG